MLIPFVTSTFTCTFVRIRSTHKLAPISAAFNGLTSFLLYILSSYCALPTLSYVRSLPPHSQPPLTASFSSLNENIDYIMLGMLKVASDCTHYTVSVCCACMPICVEHDIRIVNGWPSLSPLLLSLLLSLLFPEYNIVCAIRTMHTHTRTHTHILPFDKIFSWVKCHMQIYIRIVQFQNGGIPHRTQFVCMPWIEMEICIACCWRWWRTITTTPTISTSSIEGKG